MLRFFGYCESIKPTILGYSDSITIKVKVYLRDSGMICLTFILEKVPYGIKEGEKIMVISMINGITLYPDNFKSKEF